MNITIQTIILSTISVFCCGVWMTEKRAISDLVCAKKVLPAPPAWGILGERLFADKRRPTVGKMRLSPAAEVGLPASTCWPLSAWPQRGDGGERAHPVGDRVRKDYGVGSDGVSRAATSDASSAAAEAGVQSAPSGKAVDRRRVIERAPSRPNGACETMTARLPTSAALRMVERSDCTASEN